MDVQRESEGPKSTAMDFGITSSAATDPGTGAGDFERFSFGAGLKVQQDLGFAYASERRMEVERTKFANTSQ